MKIVIFQPMLKFYRVPLFELLHKQLTDSGHELRLVFGAPWEAEQKRNDNVVLENDYCFFEKSHWFFNNKVHFLEGAVNHIRWADIVITEQANKHVHNYILVFLHLFKIKSFAYWGHGLNRQGNPKSLKEKIKKGLAKQTDWWFAYTSGVSDYLRNLGFPSERISILNNSIDTHAFERSLNDLSSDDVIDFKRQHKIAEDAQIGIFCGSLHNDKEIEFLLESAKCVKQSNPKFILFIGGGGQDEGLVNSYAMQNEFIIYLGGLHGKQKALAFKCSDIFLNPGMIGLAILDAFTAGLPVFTTRQARHSPEIDYLEAGINGMITDLNIDQYSSVVVSILKSKNILNSLKANAERSGKKFSIENMADNFYGGLMSFITNPYC